MMRPQGYEVYHYGVEGSDSGATVDVDLLSVDEWTQLRIASYRHLFPKECADADGKSDADIQAILDDPTAFIGNMANWDTPLYKTFNQRLREALAKNYRGPGTDIVCLPFGPAHEDAIRDTPYVCVESGIGYTNSYKSYRIFESYAIMHAMLTEKGSPPNYWFVIPINYHPGDFPLCRTPVAALQTRPRIGFLGRINHSKGCHIVAEIAKRLPHVDVILCGQGNPSAFLSPTIPNLLYEPPIHGAQRAAYLGGLVATLCPTTYLEPFGSAAVEAQLCGTPVLCHDHGGFVETVEPMLTGLHCHTLADFCYGVELALAGHFDRQYIHDRAVRLYGMEAVGRRYDYTLRTILNVHRSDIVPNGWYAEKSFYESHNPHTKR
jgi:hypothetical protein